MTIPYFLLWILYFIITIDERNRYSEAVKRGMDCVGSVTRMNSITFEFNPNQPPVRRYYTWTEFWNNRGYLLKQ